MNEDRRMSVHTKYDTTKRLFHLKEVRRSGWLLSGVEFPESVADHSWGTSLLCLIFGEDYGVDVRRCLEIAVVHDVAEVITGDIPFRPDQDSNERKNCKAENEFEAMKDLLPGQDLYFLKELWEEYEESTTLEAKVVRDLNLIDMAMQALIYNTPPVRTSTNLTEFLDSAEQRLRLPISQQLFSKIKSDFHGLAPLH